ncbi:hypothetical protein LPJ59_004974 [Coemansia sp. RSA 2399]|nr:hypothetical protein LPJ59_004974 [Coemansia sp. RSA 2399]
MLGLTLGKGHAIHMYVCVPGGVLIAMVGYLPLAGTRKLRSASPDDPSEHEQRVVALLLFLYKRLGEDSGYLTRREIDVLGSLILSDIVGSVPDIRNTLSSECTVALRGEERVLSRDGHLKGQRTWVYPATVSRKKLSVRAYFKFQWAFDGDLEVDVHKFVLDRGVPHIPKLYYSATIADNCAKVDDHRYKGEAIVMEFVRSDIRSFFNERNLKYPVETLDLQTIKERK